MVCLATPLGDIFIFGSCLVSWCYSASTSYSWFYSLHGRGEIEEYIEPWYIPVTGEICKWKKNNWSSTGLLGTAPPINTQGWSYAHKWRTSSVFIKMTGLNLVFSDPSCALPTSSKCDRWAGVQSAHWRPQRSDLFGVSNDIRVSWAGMSEQGLCFCFCVLTYKALKVQPTQDDILFSGFTYPDTVA